MGLFDVGIREEIASQKSKKEISKILEEKIKVYSDEKVSTKDDVIILNNFKSSILKYNLSINLDKSNKGFNVAIDGELQQFYILIFLALIILSILFTFGIGVIFVVVFAFLQKRSTTKVINSLLENSF